MSERVSPNLRQAALETMQENALAMAMLKLAGMLPQAHWIGTPSALLVELTNLAPAQVLKRQSEWPQTPMSLSKRLKQIDPLLKAQGLEIGFSHGTQRQIEISYSPPQSAVAPDGSDGIDGSFDGSSVEPSLADCEPLAQEAI